MVRLRLVAPSAAAGLALVVAIALSAVLPGCAAASLLAAQKPSPSATSVTLASVLSGRFTKLVPEPAFLRYPTDDAGHVTYEIGALKVHAPKVLPVYILGGSNVREGVQSPAAMQAAIKQATGLTTKEVTLASFYQNFAGDLALVDNLPPGPGVVVISVNPPDFGWNLDRADAQAKGIPLLMASPALDDLLKNAGHTPPATIADGFAHYMKTWRQRNSAALKAGKRPWNVYRLHECNLRPQSLSIQQRILSRWLTTMGAPGEGFAVHHVFWAGVLAAAADLARSRGYSVVISEASYNRTLVGTKFRPYHAIYVPACRAIARKDDGWYVDPNTTAHLTAADFRDLYHMLAPGRPKWTTALARLIAPAVRQAAKAKAVTPTPAASPSPTVSASTSPSATASATATASASLTATSSASGEAAQGSVPAMVAAWLTSAWRFDLGASLLR